jgi:hypothetical protein
MAVERLERIDDVLCGSVRDAIATWIEGTRYTHEHFIADPTKYVGHIDAPRFRAAETVVVDALAALIELTKPEKPKVVELMEALEESVAKAKAARAAVRTTCPVHDWDCGGVHS